MSSSLSKDMSHMCHYGWCTNPLHVELETSSDNVPRATRAEAFLAMGRTYKCPQCPACIYVAPKTTTEVELVYNLPNAHVHDSVSAVTVPCLVDECTE